MPNYTDRVVKHDVDSINIVIPNVVKLNVLGLADFEHLADELEGSHVRVAFTVH